MRKYLKKQLLAILNTMEEANTLSKRRFKENRLEEALTLLDEQQQAAIRIGETIEATEGTDHCVVADLEAHCELLWQCGQEEHTEVRMRLYHQLHKSAVRVGLGLRWKIQEQYEIVFLPYKASMWDSLESIWLAAKEDTNSRCFVIPIPYYDRDSSGSFTTFHYEGDQFPDYVPITDYRAYDIEARHPEAIFIHNPYDECNLVTSIHPDYYSSRIQAYTDMLVYVPYFVSWDGNVPPEFCVCPGTMYADRVIVQSKTARDIYIREFRAYEKENNAVGRWGDVEKKFQALGSPKIDKVLRTCREEIELPENWANLIRNTDGTSKKVLLYNTSITSLLNNEEKFIQKLRYVFHILRTRQDIVLLWRPHPLSEATIDSMLPELHSEYQQLVSEYRMEGWGIYDDSPDLNRAIAVSDAYYGDGGSLIELYRVTGKPILLQNMEITE